MIKWIIILVCCVLLGCRNTAQRNFEETDYIVNQTIAKIQDTPTVNKTNVAIIVQARTQQMLESRSLELNRYISLLDETNQIDHEIANQFFNQYLLFVCNTNKIPKSMRPRAIKNGTDLLLDWLTDSYKLHPYYEGVILNSNVLH